MAVREYEFNKLSLDELVLINEIYLARTNEHNDFLCLAFYDGCKILLGEDWFLIYEEKEFEVYLLDWFALDNGNVFERSREMMDALVKIMLANFNKRFMASLKHTTSYRLYQYFINKGYIMETDSYVWIQQSHLESLEDQRYLEQNIGACFEDGSPYQKYADYCFHEVDFITTPKFMEKFGKSRNRNRKKK